MQKLELHIKQVQANNVKACVAGCLAFEGDSNFELINFQEYFTEPACNYSYRGSTTKSLLNRKAKLSELKPSAIVMLVGGNDLLMSTPIEDINRNYEELINYYKTICNRVYCLSNLPINSEVFARNSIKIDNPILEKVNERLKDTCSKLGAVYVPVFPHLLKNGGLNPDYAADPVHLNRAGHEILIGILKNYLKK